MQCCYCGEGFGRGKSPKTKHKDSYYHAECLQQYLAVREYYANMYKQKPLPLEFTKEMRLDSLRRETRKQQRMAERLRNRTGHRRGDIGYLEERQYAMMS